jgi:hypothetical protein
LAARLGSTAAKAWRELYTGVARLKARPDTNLPDMNLPDTNLPDVNLPDANLLLNQYLPAAQTSNGSFFFCFYVGPDLRRDQYPCPRVWSNDIRNVAITLLSPYYRGG